MWAAHALSNVTSSGVSSASSSSLPSRRSQKAAVAGAGSEENDIFWFATESFYLVSVSEKQKSMFLHMVNFVSAAAKKYSKILFRLAAGGRNIRKKGCRIFATFFALPKKVTSSKFEFTRVVDWGFHKNEVILRRCRFLPNSAW
jgi:hypothetical protein